MRTVGIGVLVRDGPVLVAPQGSLFGGYGRECWDRHVEDPRRYRILRVERRALADECEEVGMLDVLGGTQEEEAD
jgi:hypothetical protein